MVQFNDTQFKDAIVRSSPSFCEWLLPKIENLNDYVANWHVHAMSEKLVCLYHGNIKRLIVNAPPRSLKTSTCTSFFIPWLLGKDLSLQIMLSHIPMSLQSSWDLKYAVLRATQSTKGCLMIPSW